MGGLPHHDAAARHIPQRKDDQIEHHVPADGARLERVGILGRGTGQQLGRVILEAPRWDGVERPHHGDLSGDRDARGRQRERQEQGRVHGGLLHASLMGPRLPGDTLMRTLLLAAVALAALAACRDVARPERRPYSYGRAVADSAAAFARPDFLARAATPVAAQERAVAAPGDAVLFSRSSVAASTVIRTGQASIEVDSLEAAVSRVRLLAGRIGGYIANTTMQTGRGQLRSANLEVKVPAERFDEALEGLAPIGKLESVNVNAEDVGEEFTDVTARMGNARRLESRLIHLLATRTGKLKDVLDVEQELARVREEIDRYEGRLRYLRAHAVLSTFTVYVHEPLPLLGHARSGALGEAFKHPWRKFVDLLRRGVLSLGVVLPLGLVALAAWLAVKRRRKLGVAA